MEAFVSVGDAKERDLYFFPLSVRLRNDTKKREGEEDLVGLKTFFPYLSGGGTND